LFCFKGPEKCFTKIYRLLQKSFLTLPDLPKDASAVMKGFPEADSSRMNWFPKAAGLDNFCRFYTIKNGFQNLLMWLLQLLETLS
jgi:hypothetical protein